MTLQAGQTLGSFEILSPIGAGGMGQVYRARDLRLGREVAIKVLPPELAGDKAGLARFAAEARATSALNHPNIVTILEVGGAGGVPFIAMELVDGKTLRSLLEAGPMPMRRVLGIAAQMADGLSKAHAAGIVHRDLKPENVMVTRDGYAKILDFGLAKLATTGRPGDTAAFPQNLTGTGFVVGTAGYMSPEQASGKELDARSDQFAFGLILYEMTTGRRAFQKATAVQTLSAIIQEDPEPILRLNPKAPQPLVWLVERCLAKDPEERYASTKDLARDLRNLKDFVTVSGDTMGHAVPPSPLDSPLATGAVRAPGAPPSGPVPSGAPPSEVAATSFSGRTRSLTAVSPTGQAPASAPAAAPTSIARRAARLLGVVLGTLVLLGAGGVLGYWFHERRQEPPPPEWTGELLLGGATRAFSPRPSPDGQTLAFLTIVNDVAQVAVMKPGTGDWVVLTRCGGVGAPPPCTARDAGSVSRMDWSKDGSRIYFDRVAGQPVGVFSISAIGGDERLVAEAAQGPEVLPDGSLLVLKIDSGRNFQLHRLWPDSGKSAPVGPPLAREGSVLPVRAFPDGSGVLLVGRLASGTAQPRQPWVIDMASGAVTRFAPDVPLLPPFSISADGSVLATISPGDLNQVVRVSRDGSQVRTLLTMPARPASVCEGPDGSLWVGLIDAPTDILRFPTQGGVPVKLTASARNLFVHPLQAPDGRVLLPSLVAGRQRLLVAEATKPLRPFVDTAEPSAPPLALLGSSFVAFVSGGASGKPRQIVLASLADGRVVQRFEETKDVVAHALASSPDGKTLYFVAAGSVHALSVATGAVRKVCPGDGVGADPTGAFLYVQMNEKDGVRLLRQPLAGGAPEPLGLPSDYQLSPLPLGGAVAGPDGRLAVTVSRRESFFVGPALLDPATGNLSPVPVDYDGDIAPTTWGSDGLLVGRGTPLKSELWRFRPRLPQPPR